MHRSGSLEFSSVKVEDSGHYSCHAENEAGEAERAITLEVQGEHTLFIFSGFQYRLLRLDLYFNRCSPSTLVKRRVTLMATVRVQPNGGSLLFAGLWRTIFGHVGN